MLEARCTKCGETYVPEDENDLTHGQTMMEVECGGRGQITGEWVYDDTMGRLVAEYERQARINRPDWDAFIDDAQDDPAGIAYEMAECAVGMNINYDFDRVFDLAVKWTTNLTKKESI